MERHKLGFWAWLVVVSLPVAAQAQTVTPTPPASSSPITGTFSSDIIALGPNGPGVPLRHGSVVPQSEEVEFGGSVLHSGTDYAMDYAAGVVYLMRAQREGDTLSVSYRYDANPSATAGTTGSMFNGVNGLKVDLMPGVMNMRLGFGIAERAADGTVLRSNLVGWNNGFHFGSSGSLSGLLLFGDRQVVNAQSNYEAVGKKSAVDTGHSSLIYQNFGSNFMGGKVSAQYQDISQNFTGFAGAADSGIDSKTLTQLQKERGLTRTGYGLEGLKFGSFQFSNGYRTVSDGNGTVEWRNLGIQEGGLKIAWSSQRVDSKFTRFADLGEENRTDLQRSSGMSRQNMEIGFASKGRELSFKSLDIEDTAGGHILTRETEAKFGGVSFGFGDATTQSQFHNFNGLYDAEKVTYGADGGLRRQWANFAVAGSKQFLPFKYQQSWIKSDSGDFQSSEVALAGRSWTLSHAGQSADPGFHSFTALNPTETDAQIGVIAKMYPGLAPVNPASERGAFAAGAGLTRSATSLAWTPSKAANISGGISSLSGGKDGATVANAAIKIGHVGFNLQRLTVGRDFNELGHTMGFERGYLGTIQGLEKSNIDFSWSGSHGRTFDYQSMVASTEKGGAARTTFKLNDPRLTVEYNSRQVDQGFSRVGEIVDPERPLLISLLGFNESDSKVHWAPISGLTFDGNYLNSDGQAGQNFHRLSSSSINYHSHGTNLGFSRSSQDSSDLFSMLFANVVEKYDLSQHTNWGSFSMSSEKQHFGGTETTSSAQPSTVVNQDFEKKTVGVEVNLTKTTSLATEQSSTAYANGLHESMRSNSLSTKISERAGLTVSDTQFDRPDSLNNNEVKRNYGFWYDLGRGVILSYGYVRQLDSSGVSSLVDSVTVGQAAPGTAPSNALGNVNQGLIGGLAVGGGYGTNQNSTVTNGADSTRTQSFSNVRINSAKPFKFGSLKNLKFNFSLDTAADNFNWIRENRQLGLSGTYHSSGFGFDYHSQMDPLGDRAVDRSFSYNSDPAGKQAFSIAGLYKVRTLPASQVTPTGNPSIMIRNFAATIRPARRLSISNQVMTNPEVLKGDAMLGSVTQGARINKWNLDFTGTKDTLLTGSWEEMVNEDNHAIGQTTGLTLTLFNSKSPLTLFYGVENVDGNIAHRLTERWSVKFDQRAGPHQSFSFFVGDLSYGYSLPTDQSVHNITARFNYQLRF